MRPTSEASSYSSWRGETTRAIGSGRSSVFFGFGQSTPHTLGVEVTGIEGGGLFVAMQGDEIITSETGFRVYDGVGATRRLANWAE